MRIIVFSDIHGNNLVLDDLQNYFNFLKPDKIIFLGDLFGYYYNYIEIINFFEKNNVESILGNHDVYALELLNGNLENLHDYILKYGNGYDFSKKFKDIYLNYLLKKSKQKELVVNGKKILFVHGSPQNNTSGRLYPDSNFAFMKSLPYDIVFCGHTHHRFLTTIENKVVVNVGSIGQPRDGYEPCFLLYEQKIDSDLFQFHEVKYNKEELYSQLLKYKDNNKPYSQIIYRKPKYLI